MAKIKFNEQQIKAINHINGPAMVVAGAGSGKSTVLVHRIDNLIENGVDQEDIVAITFTKNSADDLKRKLNNLGILDVRVGTFHSVLSRMLSDNGVNVFKTVPPFEIKKAFNEVNFNSDVDDILSFISYQKSYMRGYNDTFVAKESKYTDIELSQYYRIYEELKRDKNAYDFDDWLIEALKILKLKPNAFECKYLLVDEHQDNNLIQNLLIKEMCPSENIMVIGDYRQSIYSFRGAEPKYFMNFKSQYPNAEVIHLDNNYRSCEDIIHTSNRFIKNYFGGYEYYSDSVPTVKDKATINFEVYESKEDEAEEVADIIRDMIKFQGIKPKDIAILYRMNNMTSDIEVALTKRNIPYHIENDSNFFKSRQLIPIISVLRLIEDGNDDEAFLNLLKSRCYPFTFIPKKVVPDIEMFAFENDLSYMKASVEMYLPQKQKQSFTNFKNIVTSLRLRYVKNELDLKEVIEKIAFLLKMDDYIDSNWNGEEQDRRRESIISFTKFAQNSTIKSFLKFINSNNNNSKSKDANAVQLMTIHRSKGLEWDNVFLIGLEEGKFPSKKATLEEEARLFYVATTRPKKFLHICQNGKDNIFGNQYRGLPIKNK